MEMENLLMESLLNRIIKLPTHFPEPVKVESITKVGAYYKLRVRKIDGYLEEVMVSMYHRDGIGAVNIFARYLGIESQVVAGLAPVRGVRYKAHLCGHGVKNAPWKTA